MTEAHDARLRGKVISPQPPPSGSLREDFAREIMEAGDEAGRWIVALKVADRCLSLLPAEKVAEGFKVVPVEPTKAAIRAVEFAIYRHADCSARDAERAAPQVYAAVLSASPSPPTAEGKP